MKRYIIGIDEGTTSVRSILYDVKLNQIIQIERKTFKQIYPKSGWVEHDAQEILNATKYTLSCMFNQINPNDVYGIGITNQRETVVAWDKKTGKPLYNAIVWQCRRTSRYCKTKLSGSKANTIRKITGLLPDAYFSATKIQWLLQKVPKLKDMANKNELCVGTMESFLVFNLTKEKSFVTDSSNASRTMLYNIHNNTWDEKLLKMFDISLNILPKIVDNDEIVGHFAVDGAEIPVAGLIGDQQSSLFGQCCFNSGDIKNTYGTGSFMLLNIGNKPIFSKHKLLTTVAWRRKGVTTYAIEGSVFNSGSAVEWLVGNMEVVKTPEESDIVAQNIDDTDGTFFVPAFTGLGAPYWDSDARGMFYGINRSTNKEHLVRAVLESIAYCVKDIYDVMLKDAGKNARSVRFDGGVSKSAFVMQLQAELFGQAIEKSLVKESTALGAIYMCGLATGVWKDYNELSNIYQVDKVFKPSKDREKYLNTYKDWKKVVQKTLTK